VVALDPGPARAGLPLALKARGLVAEVAHTHHVSLISSVGHPASWRQIQPAARPAEVGILSVRKSSIISNRDIILILLLLNLTKKLV
jgi:hypothetical protein